MADESIKDVAHDGTNGSAESHSVNDTTANETTTANGTAEDNKTETDAPTAQDASEQTSTTDNKEDTAQSASAATTPANGKNKRKSSTGIPEHKSKKLNKKKSMPNLNLDAQPGDYYWARWRGTAPWPAIILAQDMLPPDLLSKRPVSAAQPDGTYREDFAEGGKNAKDRSYPILFLGENNMTWIVNTALTKLNKEDCANTENKKLSKFLTKAYEVAVDAPGLEYFREILNTAAEQRMQWEIAEKEAEIALEKEMQEDAAAKAAEAAEPKPKKPRKSKGADTEPMDVEGDADEKTKSSKKRKKDATSDGEQQAKKPAKVRLSTTKAAKDTPAKKSTKGKKPATEPADGEEEDRDPHETVRVAIMFLRHKLQKGFLSRDVPTSGDEMPQLAEYLAQLEAAPELEASIIRTTKIHKVLKGILKLPEVPRNEEFNFTSRCADLLKMWEEVLSKDGAPMSAVEAPAGKTNGVKSDDNAAAASLDTAAKEEAAEKKDEDGEKSEKKEEAPAVIGNSTADEGDAAADVTMSDAKDEKIAPGSSKDQPAPAGDESAKTLEANAGDAAA